MITAGTIIYLRPTNIENGLLAAAREHSEIRFEAQFTESEYCLVPIFNVRGSKDDVRYSLNL